MKNRTILQEKKSASGEKKRRKYWTSSTKIRIGCIVIINIIMKFNGKLFTHESFTLDTNTQTQNDDMYV